MKETAERARQELRDKPSIETSPAEKYLNIMEISTKYLRTITGHELTTTEFEYEITKHVKLTEFYGKEIVGAMGERELIALRNRLIIVDNSTNSMINLIDKK